MYNESGGNNQSFTKARPKGMPRQENRHTPVDLKQLRTKLEPTLVEFERRLPSDINLCTHRDLQIMGLIQLCRLAEREDIVLRAWEDIGKMLGLYTIKVEEEDNKKKAVEEDLTRLAQEAKKKIEVASDDKPR